MKDGFRYLTRDISTNHLYTVRELNPLLPICKKGTLTDELTVCIWESIGFPRLIHAVLLGQHMTMLTVRHTPRSGCQLKVLARLSQLSTNTLATLTVYTQKSSSFVVVGKERLERSINNL